MEDGNNSRTDKSTVQHTTSSDPKIRSISKSIGDNEPTISRTTDKTRGDRQLLKDKLEHARGINRRSSDDSISKPESSNGSRGGSRELAIERLDEIPTRDFGLEEKEKEEKEEEKKKKEKVTKEKFQETAIAVKQKVFKPGKVLTEEEAESFSEVLPDALIDYGDYIDKYIRWKTNQSEEEMLPIWGDLSNEEAQTLTRVLIRRGKKNAVAAELVRELANGYDYIATAVIVVPRAMKTNFEMRKAPRKEKR